MTEAPRVPYFLVCPTCRHRWQAFSLPLPITAFCAALKHAVCPACGDRDMPLSAIEGNPAEDGRQRRSP